MFHKKPKLIYKKNPYVGKRQIRRRVIAIVNDMLVTLSENNQNTEKIDNVSTDNNNGEVSEKDNTIDTVVHCNNSMSNEIDFNFKYLCNNSLYIILKYT